MVLTSIKTYAILQNQAQKGLDKAEEVYGQITSKFAL